MESYGYEVRRGVLSPSECDAAMKGKGCDYPHSASMWAIRTHPAVKAAFADVWKVGPEELLSSFDGMAFRPAGEGYSLPWHIDHDASVPSCEMTSVQGILALEAVSASTGGTQLLPGSHRRTKALCSRLEADEDEEEWPFTEVPDDDPVFRGLTPVQPELGKGDLLLWESRTVHRVVEPEDPSSSRCVAFLSMAPRKLVPEPVLKRRLSAFRRGAASTHWVQRFVEREGGRRPPDRVLRDEGVWRMVR